MTDINSQTQKAAADDNATDSFDEIDEPFDEGMEEEDPDGLDFSPHVDVWRSGNRTNRGRKANQAFRKR